MKPNFRKLGPKYGKSMKMLSDLIINATINDAINLQINKKLNLSFFVIEIDEVEFNSKETIIYQRYCKLKRILK